jgi:hypothetical protein
MKHLAAAVLCAALLWPAVVHAGAGEPLPRTLRVTAPLSYVSCSGPCCCGEVTVRKYGRYYGDASYCRWFRPLRDGQLVTTTVSLIQ